MILTNRNLITDKLTRSFVSFIRLCINWQINLAKFQLAFDHQQIYHFFNNCLPVNSLSLFSFLFPIDIFFWNLTDWTLPQNQLNTLFYRMIRTTPRAQSLKKTMVKADIYKAGQINVSRSWKSLGLSENVDWNCGIQLTEIKCGNESGFSRIYEFLVLTRRKNEVFNIDSRNNCPVHTLLLYARKFFLFTFKKKVSKFSTLSGYIIKYHPPNRRQYKTPVDVKVGEGGGDGRNGEGVSYPQPCRGSWCFFFQDVISEK